MPRTRLGSFRSRPLVWECPDCGRLWVYARPRGNNLVTFVDLEHVGGCVPDEPASWTTRCEGKPLAVETWPVLLSAWLLAGKDAAEACVRPKAQRLKARRSVARMGIHHASP